MFWTAAMVILVGAGGPKQPVAWAAPLECYVALGGDIQTAAVMIEAPPPRGDCDWDGVLDNDDVAICLAIANGQQSPPWTVWQADVTNDGQVTSSDVTWLLKRVD